MKIPLPFLAIILGLSLTGGHAEARGEGKRGGGGGGGRASAPQRSSPSRTNSSANRSPMTGSKVSRPAQRPAPKPAARPEAKPAPRPEARPAPKPAQRPSVERPTTRPAPDRKPDIGRPGGGDNDNRPGNGNGNGNRPGNGGGRPETKPFPGPGGNNGDNRPGPGAGNGDRPGAGNGNRPGNGADNRPGPRPETRPMPRPDRPNASRPSTLPGMVTYPNRPGNGNGSRPGNNNRPNWGNGNGNNTNSGNTYINNINNINKNRKNTYLNRPATLPADRRNWDNNRWGGNRGVWGNNNDINIRVNNNFRYNNNYSYRPNYWGARPWWGAGSCHTWHHGHWNYGYNSHYYGSRYYYSDSSFASGFMWGIAVWSLGNMVYDMGYQSYRNPYPAPAVQNTTINYAQPVSVTAAANPPGDEKTTELAETKSAEATEASRAAFKRGDYFTALKSADEAIARTPGDVTLHEYRALVLFALGRYSDAAGVLNPVLASGPGWGWDTMVGFYDSSATYTAQLRKLEAYVKGRPEAADGRFLLGYHYLVCDYMDKAYGQFEIAAKLQPADSISRQLRDLTKSSLPDAGTDEPAEEAPAPPPPIPTEKLVGTWVSDRGADGKVTFKMEENGDYTWNYVNGPDTKELKGTYGLDDKGLLVLTSDDSQMVAAVTLDGEVKLKFTLVGAPDGDPGLDFTKG